MMTNPGTISDYHIVEAMRIYGGSFVQALAEAFVRADPDNLARLKAAFPEYWEKYRDMAAKRRNATLEQA